VLYQIRKLELVSTRGRYEISKNSILIAFRPRPKIQEISSKKSQPRTHEIE